MTNPNRIRIRDRGKHRDVPLRPPAPRWRGDELIIQTDKGQERVEKDKIVGWQYDGKTH